MPDPTVSVITPAYAHAAFIRECLESVRAQTFTDWELVVVDDGSPDDTVDRARAVGDERIRVLSRSHVGLGRLSETYNAGLAECRGRYIAVLEGDDRWEPGKLATQVPIMRDRPVVLTYARYAVMSSRGALVAAPPLAGPVRSGMLDALGPLMLDSFVELGTVMMARDALERVGGFRQLPGHHHVDYATFLALAELGPFFACDEVVLHWRRHVGSATVQAVTSPRNFEGAGLCRDLALETRRRAGRTDLPSEIAIRRSWANVLARRYWHSGRVLLARGRRPPARDLFLAGLRIGRVSARQRLALALGAIASVLGIDVERIAGLVGRTSALKDL